MGRVYATAADYQEWTGVAGPADIDRRLARASELVELATKTALYDVDAAGMPTAAEVVTALQEATCAAAEHLLETGDEHGLAAEWQNVTAGSMTLGGRRQVAGGPLPGSPAHRIGPQARTVLTLAGLLDGGIDTGGDRWTCHGG